MAANYKDIGALQSGGTGGANNLSLGALQPVSSITTAAIAAVSTWFAPSATAQTRFTVPASAALSTWVAPSATTLLNIRRAISITGSRASYSIAGSRASYHIEGS